MGKSMEYDSLKRMPSGGLASFLTSNMDEIEDNVIAFGAPRGINSMVDVGNRMAQMGRNGDDQLVHMRTGEIAVSPELLKENPQLAGQLSEAFERSNVDMDRYVVGSGANSINPMTGQREFFLKKLIKGIKKVFKKIAPIIIPIGLNMIMPGLGAVGSGALGAGITTLVQGGSFKDALKSAAFGGLAGGLTAGFQAGGFTGEEFQKAAFGKLGGAEGPMFKNPFKTAAGSGKIAAQSNTGPGPSESKGILSSGVDKAKDLYSKYLDPNRGVMDPATQLSEVAKIVQENPDLVKSVGKDAVVKMAQDTIAAQQPGLIARYGPLAAVGTGIAAAAGAFETPEVEVEEPFGMTSQELFDSNPTKYSVFSRIPFRTPLSPVRPTENKSYSDYVYKNYLPQYAAQGGEMFPRRQGYIAGPGTETSDDIPAMLSDGEFVMTARAVRGLGNGSRQQGVKKMYDLMRKFEGGAVA
jgi:hypothetical protein